MAEQQLDEFRRAVDAANKALDAFDGATDALRQALASIRAWTETKQGPPDSETLLVADVVRKYRVSKRVVLEARRKGHLRARRPLGTNVLLFDPVDVESWVEGRGQKVRVAR